MEEGSGSAPGSLEGHSGRLSDPSKESQWVEEHCGVRSLMATQRGFGTRSPADEVPFLSQIGKHQKALWITIRISSPFWVVPSNC